jgi:hypothetical protein
MAALQMGVGNLVTRICFYKPRLSQYRQYQRPAAHTQLKSMGSLQLLRSVLWDDEATKLRLLSAASDTSSTT